ncbi:MAG: hypothetical protein QME41_04490 [Actinomycetota bacterium]|nr:hypothetical protein [Actinomycetota bacterium]
MALTSNDTTNTIGSTNTTDTLMSWSGWSDASAATMQGFFKQSRTTDWASDWRTTSNSVAMGQRLTSAGVAANCSDDGFSWPHRTLGWKMLKDDLFGLNFDNNTWVGVGEERFDGTTTHTAHDLDSVCLDCHNPNVWRATNTGDGNRLDTPSLSSDDHNDELLTRGLP